jgi:hypothetical protein
MKKETLQKVINIHEGPSWGSWRSPSLTGNFGESEIFFYQTLFITEVERFVKDVSGDRHLKPYEPHLGTWKATLLPRNSRDGRRRALEMERLPLYGSSARETWKEDSSI